MRGTDFPIFGEKIFGRCDGRIFHCKRKRFCHIRKLLEKVLKKSENRPDSYLDLRKARCGFTTQSKEVVPLGVNKNIRTATNVISR